MNFTIAIQPDQYSDGSGEAYHDSFSACWADYLADKGHTVKYVDVWGKDILSQLKGCHGLMWRWAHGGSHALLAQRLLPVVERTLQLPVFPDQQTCWHYDDKVAQAFLFQALKIPHPETYLFFREKDALLWLESEASFPLVLKLSSGAGSVNVRKIINIAEGKEWVRRLFLKGVCTLAEPPGKRSRLSDLFSRVAEELTSGWPTRLRPEQFITHKGYVLFQKFLGGNTYDTRVTVVGNRAFAFRRFNRQGDFRASGSGLINYDIEGIDLRFIRLAFAVAAKIGAQSCAIDGMYDGDSPVVGEITYTYAHYAVHDCPGYWSLDGLPDSGELVWHNRPMWPAEAQAEDFLKVVQTRWAK